jgi:hypothetical protein
MTEQKKTALTKQEKKAIKDSCETGIMSEEEWARVQGITYSELRKESTGIRNWANKYDNKMWL